MANKCPIRETPFQVLSIRASCDPSKENSGGGSVPEMQTTNRLSADRKNLTIEMVLSVQLFNVKNEKTAEVDVKTSCGFSFNAPMDERAIHSPVALLPFVSAIYQRTAEKVQREFEVMGYFVQLPLIPPFVPEEKKS